MKLPKYEIVLREKCKSYTRQVVKFENGTTVDMRIPDHTPEEKKKLEEQITKACFEFVFPNENWDGKRLKVIQ